MFSELEQQVEAWESDEAREAYVKGLVEMDLVWDKLVRTNISVMSTMVAASKADQRVLACEVCEGVMGLMGRMCEAWAFTSGNVTVTLPDQQQVFEESKVVDAAGTMLRKAADPFLDVILSRMVLPLMSKWAEMFALAAKSRNNSVDAMSTSDSASLSSSCSEELLRGFEQARADLMAALESGSRQLIAGEMWVSKARPRFEAIVHSWGPGFEGQAMEAVVKEMGFPDATL